MLNPAAPEWSRMIQEGGRKGRAMEHPVAPPLPDPRQGQLHEGGPEHQHHRRPGAPKGCRLGAAPQGSGDVGSQGPPRHDQLLGGHRMGTRAVGPMT